jgi:O-antigen ligase/Flp pilus assembly protein TadD
MALSKKKKRTIRRMARHRNVAEIASALGLPKAEVQKILGAPAVKTDIASTAPADKRDMALSWGIMGLLFLGPLVILPRFYHYANLPKLAFFEIGAVLLSLICGMKHYGDNRLIFPRTPLNRPILLFMAWALVSLGYAHTPYEGLVTWLGWAAAVLIFYLAAEVLRSGENVSKLITVMTASGTVCAVLGIAQYLFGLSWIPQSIPPAVTFGNKNMAVHFIVLTTPLGAGLFLGARTQRGIWLAGFSTALMVLFLIYTRTRSGWVALAAQTLFLAALVAWHRFSRHRPVIAELRTKTRAALCALGFLLVMLNAGPDGFRWGFGEIIDRAATVTEPNIYAEMKSGSYSSIGLRVAVWRSTLEMAKDHPWTGVGLGNHKVKYPLYHHNAAGQEAFDLTSGLIHAHNDYLQVVSELGLVGILLIGWMGWAAVRHAAGVVASDNREDDRFEGFGVVAALMGILVVACFSFPFQRAVPPFMAMVLLALMVSMDDRGKENVRRPTPPRPIITGLVSLSGIGLVLLCWFYASALKIDHALFNLARYNRAGAFEAMVVEGEKTDGLCGDRSKVFGFLGRAYIETGKYNEAIRVLKSVTKDHPHIINYLYHLGLAYANNGDYPQAIETFQDALKMKPDFPHIHNNIGKIRRLQKQPGLALAAFQTAAQIEPGNSGIFFDIGVLSYKMKQYADSAAAFGRVLALDPKNAMAHKNIGILYWKNMDRKEEGLGHIKQALRLDPGIKDARALRAIIGENGWK